MTASVFGRQAIVTSVDSVCFCALRSLRSWTTYRRLWRTLPFRVPSRNSHGRSIDDRPNVRRDWHRMMPFCRIGGAQEREE